MFDVVYFPGRYAFKLQPTVMCKRFICAVCIYAYAVCKNIPEKICTWLALTFVWQWLSKDEFLFLAFKIIFLTLRQSWYGTGISGQTLKNVGKFVTSTVNNRWYNHKNETNQQMCAYFVGYICIPYKIYTWFWVSFVLLWLVDQVMAVLLTRFAIN